MDKPFALLIEDDRDVAALFRHVLDMAGYRTEILFDGQGALERISATLPDVILLDLQLPNVSGPEILEQMRTDEQLSTIPVVVITAFAHYANTLPIEPDLFLIKPVDIQDLGTLVQRLSAPKTGLKESPYDEVTNLYTIPFFSVRLVLAFERVKKTDLERFGVLFADLHPYDTLKEKMNANLLNALLRKMADQFKGSLRPTDTMAWSHNGFFLSLLEDVAVDDKTKMIAKRVAKKMNGFLAQHDLSAEQSAQIGVIMCDDKYNNIEEIMEDINFARSLVKHEPNASNWIYTREQLKDRRAQNGRVKGS